MWRVLENIRIKYMKEKVIAIERDIYTLVSEVVYGSIAHKIDTERYFFRKTVLEQLFWLYISCFKNVVQM